MDLTVAILRFLSGLCFVWPAIKLTGDLRFIKNLKKLIEDHTTGKKKLGDDSFELLNSISISIETRNKQWNSFDAAILYIGLAFFIFSSLLQIIMIVRSTST